MLHAKTVDSQHVVKHSEDKGTVHNKSKDNSGRPASVAKNQDCFDAVQDDGMNSLRNPKAGTPRSPASNRRQSSISPLGN